MTLNISIVPFLITFGLAVMLTFDLLTQHLISSSSSYSYSRSSAQGQGHRRKTCLYYATYICGWTDL